MKRMLLTLCYDGTAYHGWQVQENATTVQQVLQDALERLLKTRPAVTGCSRTDAGVHAKEFCCHLDCDDSIPPEAFLRGLNSILPPDIAVRKAECVPDGFHARYAARGKNYLYRMYVSPITDPFRANYALRLGAEPDCDKMQTFCRSLEGTHDFIAFSSSGRSTADTVRTVKECFVEKKDDELILSVTADGFLYNMVRIITGTALAVGYGRLSADCAKAAFATGDRNLLGDTAAPQGLYLNRVFYDEP